jgi:hypothetical protein
VSGFTPTYHVPAGTGKGSCTTTNINNFDSKCLNGTNSCGTSSAGSSACLACLYSSSPTNSTWGTIIQQAALGFFELNMGGCYAAEAASELACGQATQDQLECEHYECDPTSIDLTSYSTCVTTEDKSDCKCYVTAATSACSGFSTSACDINNYSGSTAFDDAFKAMAAVMCGP